MKSKLYNKKTIILIGGPTASGKSSLANNLAEELDGEIINADSMQVYKNFPILTSQPSETDRKKIKHYLYGYFDTNKSCNGSIWLKDSYCYIEKIFSKRKVPIVVGGSGLYLEFMSEGISLIPNISEKTKNKLATIKYNEGLKSLYTMLEKVDSKYAKKISVNDKTRILRALEVFYETGKNISFYHSKKKHRKNYNFYKIFLSPSKEQVAKNATIRLKKMIERGLLEEFNKNKKNVRNCNISKAIGFQELNDYSETKKTISHLLNDIISSTTKYAKRQFTWFNNRYKPQIKIDSYKKKSLILESLSKII